METIPRLFSTDSILGPLIITPKIPVPNTHTWFYEKFRFAKSLEELSGSPGFGLKAPNSYAVMAAMMPQCLPKSPPNPQEQRKEADLAPPEVVEDVKKERKIDAPSSPSLFSMPPKPPGV